MSGRFFSSSLAAALAFFSASCRQVNQYENNFTPSAQGVAFLKVPPGTRPELYEIEDWTLLRHYQEKEHYAVIGFSSFCQSWVPRYQALRCAEKIGAPLVLVYSTAAESDRPRPLSVPDHQPYGGVFLPTRNYGWIKRLHGFVPVTDNPVGANYHQFAYYLAKREHVNSFGVYFLFPASARDSRIRIGVVVPGSPAAKQGIRPGDRVVSINGRRVFGPEDVIPFAVNKEEIVHMEAVHE